MHRFKIILALLAVSFISFLNWNCTKIDTTLIGSDLIPPVDNVHTFDTSISVIAVNYDTASTFCDTLYRHADHALGYISNDPLFGKTTASIFAEFKPSSFPFTFPAQKDSLTGDSVVLVLQHTRSFGDSSVPQKVNVFLINSGTFRSDTTYTSCTSFPFNNFPIGTATYVPAHLKDTSKNFGDTSINELRIKLSGSLVAGIFNQDSSTFKSDSLYKIFFQGLAIMPDVSFGGNALSYFNLDSSHTKLAIYYHYIKNGVKDTAVSNFVFSGLTGEVNQISRDRSGAAINSHLSHNPTGDDQIFIQTSPGSFANITIPKLSGLSNRIIHRAELSMESIGNVGSDPFQAPDFLYLETKDSSLGNAYHPIPCDFTVANQGGSLGGSRKSVTDALGNPVSQYVFNVTRYVQNFVVHGRSDMSLRLSAPTRVIGRFSYNDYCGQPFVPFNYPLNYNAFGRVVLGGGNNANYKMRLRIIYSNL